MRKSILITGCSSGIGYDAAHGLNARGWRVFATCRQEADCERLRGEGLESFVLDYADDASVAAAAEEALNRCDGRLDALFNNGAYALPAAVEDLPRDAIRELFETNLFGQIDLMNRVIPAMRAQGHGRIVNCSSVLGFVALRMRGAYSASKFALEAFTDTARLELRDTGLHFILIQPGPIVSRIRQNSLPPFERWIDWEKSPFRTVYKSGVIPFISADEPPPNRHRLPPSAVTAKLIRALESPRPKARYKVTTPTYAAAAMKTLFPARLQDYIFSKM